MTKIDHLYLALDSKLVNINHNQKILQEIQLLWIFLKCCRLCPSLEFQIVLYDVFVCNCVCIVYCIVDEIQSYQFSFFRENVDIIVISELRPGSNERNENSTFYGPFRFLIFILVFSKQIILYISQFIEKLHEMAFPYLLH